MKRGIFWTMKTMIKELPLRDTGPLSGFSNSLHLDLSRFSFAVWPFLHTVLHRPRIG